MNPSKRILVWFWGPRGGGGSQYSVLLARRLGQRFGADSVFLSLHGGDETRDMAHALGVNVLSAEVTSDRKKPLATVAGLLRSRLIVEAHIREARADVVCIGMNFASAAPLAASIAKPIVYFAHDPAPHPGDFAARGQRLTQEYFLRRADAVVALSAQAGEDLARKHGGIRNKLHIAPLGAVFEPHGLRAPRAGPVRMLFLGRMLRYKGLDILADALASIRNRTDWRLTVAGDGPELDERLKARMRDSRIEIRPGFLRYDEVDALFASHDVLLASYRSASQSGVVAQALSWGMPVVATSVGALAEQMDGGRAGWLAEAVTPEAFGAALNAMLDDPQERMRKAEAALAISNTTWKSDSWSWIAEL